jgi:N6-L-threonylcarbamoyladenine synthase
MLKVREARDAGNFDGQRADFAASFQRAVVDTLVTRTLKAARHTSAARIIVAGGVGANHLLRADLAQRFDGTVYYPRLEFCTDNGAMIAVAGAMRVAEASTADEIKAVARWPLDTLKPPVNKAEL